MRTDGTDDDDAEPYRPVHAADDRLTVRFGRFLGITFIGSLIPGVGLIAAGRRRLGGAILAMLALLVVASAAVVAVTPTGKLASYGGDRKALLYIAIGMTALAAIWLLIALMSHRSLEPRDLSGGRRLAGALAVIVAASLVVVPMTAAARAAWTQRDVIESISASGSAEKSKTVPVNVEDDDPWEKIPRLNILVLGADVGKTRDDDGRDIRPDTQVVLSIDTQTGDMTMISLPRNLSQMPFPESSQLADVYPDGFVDLTTYDPLNANSMLNAVYKNVPALHPDLELSGADANKLAVSGALDLNIHYFVMVNLDGFEEIVDAFGSISIDVTERVPIIYGQNPDSAYCVNTAQDFIEVGKQQMDGPTALLYARSRCNTSNYRRMERQQCVIDAVIDRANPMTLATKYQALAKATKGMVRTDIPSGLFPELIELIVDVKGGEIATMSLNHELFNEVGGSAADPNYDGIQQAVQEAFDPPDSAPGDEQDGGTTPGADDDLGGTEAGDDDFGEDGTGDDTGAGDEADTGGDTDGDGTPDEDEPKGC